MLLALACAAAIDVVLSVGAMGPQAAWNEHLRWWNREGARSTSQQLTADGLIDEDRLTNQSTMVVMRRLLTRFGGKLHYAKLYPWRANFNAAQLTAAYAIVVGLLGLGVAVYCRRPARRTSPGQWSNEIAMAALSTLWFSPVVWSYYPTAAAPVAVVLGKVVAAPRPGLDRDLHVDGGDIPVGPECRPGVGRSALAQLRPRGDAGVDWRRRGIRDWGLGIGERSPSPSGRGLG